MLGRDADGVTLEIEDDADEAQSMPVVCLGSEAIAHLAAARADRGANGEEP